MTIKAVIVEDNLENIQTLKYVLKLCSFDIEILGEASTMEEAYLLLQTDSLDLAFLDIQLKKGTSFEVLQQLYANNAKLPEIVFVTAHGSFDNALKAIQFACLDFVTKPFDKEDIESAIDRYINKKQSSQLSQQEQVGFLLELLKGDVHKPKSIAINLSNGVIEFTELGHIIYFLADENMSKVNVLDGKILHSTKHLGHYIDLLMIHPQFIQISKSCLVNTRHLKQYNHREKTLLMKNGESLIASHRFSRNLKKQLLESQQNKPGFLGRFFRN